MTQEQELYKQDHENWQRDMLRSIENSQLDIDYAQKKIAYWQHVVENETESIKLKKERFDVANANFAKWLKEVE